MEQSITYMMLPVCVLLCCCGSCLHGRCHLGISLQRARQQADIINHGGLADMVQMLATRQLCASRLMRVTDLRLCCVTVCRVSSEGFPLGCKTLPIAVELLCCCGNPCIHSCKCLSGSSSFCFFCRQLLPVVVSWTICYTRNQRVTEAQITSDTMDRAMMHRCVYAERGCTCT